MGQQIRNRRLSGRTRSRAKWRVADLCCAMESIAPHALAQKWDNVGLLAGDAEAALSKVLLCIDLTSAVANEAVVRRAECVLCYHPPIFKPILSIGPNGRGPEANVHRCIRHGIAVYATHTALDAAEGGTNDVLAELCGVEKTEPLEYVPGPGGVQYKLVVFVPANVLDKVADAMFEAGAGLIGDYANCSFRIPGTGTFLGGISTNPTIGTRGRMETVQEVRLEVIVDEGKLAAAVAAMRGVHPYEEPAFDIYALCSPPVRGIGRIGRLPRPVRLDRLAQTLKRNTSARCVQLVGEADSKVERVIVVAGAAGELAFRAGLAAGDCVVTGEIRHHDALEIAHRGASAIVLGHWASERPVLFPLAGRLGQKLPQVKFIVGESDQDPFRIA